MKTLQQYRLKSPCRPCICGADGKPVTESLSPRLRQHRAELGAVPAQELNDFWSMVFSPPTPIAPVTVEYVYEIEPVQPFALARD